MSIFNKAICIFDVGDEARVAYEETGLTPRQLAEQRAQLLDALRQVVDFFEPGAWGSAENKCDALHDARLAISIAEARP